MSQRPSGPQHDLGVQHRAVRRRRRPCGWAATSRSLLESIAARSGNSRSRGFRCCSTRSAPPFSRSWSKAPAAVPAGQARQGSASKTGRGARRMRTPSCSRAAGSPSDELDERANRVAHRLREPRRRTRSARRHLHEQVARSRRRRARGDQGGRGVRPARSDVPGRAHRVHAARTPAPRCSSPTADEQPPVGEPRRHRLLGVGRARRRIGRAAPDTSPAQTISPT